MTILVIINAFYQSQSCYKMYVKYSFRYDLKYYKNLTENSINFTIRFNLNSFSVCL